MVVCFAVFTFKIPLSRLALVIGLKDECLTKKRRQPFFNHQLSFAFCPEPVLTNDIASQRETDSRSQRESEIFRTGAVMSSNSSDAAWRHTTQIQNNPMIRRRRKDSSLVISVATQLAADIKQSRLSIIQNNPMIRRRNGCIVFLTKLQTARPLCVVYL